MLFRSERDRIAASHPHNIVHVDYPVERDGASRYGVCADTLRQWLAAGIVATDDTATFSLYRMAFTDESGARRQTVGVIGALEVVDDGAGGVLPHERTTPKAKTDRLDLTRATACNLSPVWGLSLTAGLSELLTEPAEVVAHVVDPDGVEHTLNPWQQKLMAWRAAGEAQGNDMSWMDKPNGMVGPSGQTMSYAQATAPRGTGLRPRGPMSGQQTNRMRKAILGVPEY